MRWRPEPRCLRHLSNVDWWCVSISGGSPEANAAAEGENRGDVDYRADLTLGRCRHAHWEWSPDIPGSVEPPRRAVLSSATATARLRQVSDVGSSAGVRESTDRHQGSLLRGVPFTDARSIPQ